MEQKNKQVIIKDRNTGEILDVRTLTGRRAEKANCEILKVGYAQNKARFLVKEEWENSNKAGSFQNEEEARRAFEEEAKEKEKDIEVKII